MTRLFLAALAGIVDATPTIAHTNLLQMSADSSTFTYDEPAPTTDLIQTRSQSRTSSAAGSHTSLADAFSDTLLAQTRDSGLFISDNYCQYAHNRIKGAGDIFYDVQTDPRKLEYLDTTFPKETMVYNPDFKQGKDDDVRNIEGITWLESIDLRWEDSYYSLFGTESDVTGHATDIYQGSIGNCWFMHGASAVAKDPVRLKNIFYNDELSSVGIYALRVYVLGVPTTITVDDRIPLVDGTSIFGAASPDGALWGMLIEKAFAKIHGNYESIESGDARASIDVLTGAPYKGYYHDTTTDSSPNNDSPETVWNAIVQAVADGNMISSSTGGTSNTQASQYGIANSHVYTILSAHEIGGEKLIRIRNPWGRNEKYTGPWSDKSENWTDSIKDLVHYLDESDGIFFMDLDTYYLEFEDTVVHFATTDMTQTYFLVTNDDAVNNAAGTLNPNKRTMWDKTRSQHTFTITSPADQKIYIAMHTWSLRTYPNDCKSGPGSASHYAIVTDKDRNDEAPADVRKDIWLGINGQSYYSGFEMKAGQQLEVEFGLDWQENESRDFSLVVWGTSDQPTTITADMEYTRKLASHWPLTVKREDDENADTENGADLCLENPQEAAFRTYYNQFKKYTIEECSWQRSYQYSGDGGLFYAYSAACQTEQYVVTLTLPQETWIKSWISDGSILMDTTGSGGQVKKRFLLKVGPEYADRVAFYFPGYLNVKVEDLAITIDLCQDDSCTDFDSYSTIRRDGNDQNECPTDPYEITHTTGTGTEVRTYNPPAVPPTPVIPSFSNDEIQHMIYKHMQTVEIVSPEANCSYRNRDASVPGHEDTHMFNVFMFNCAGGSPWFIQVEVTDTEDNWAKTVDHCANVLLKTSDPDADGMVTKTYGLLGDIDMKTVTFFRQAGSRPDAQLAGWVDPKDVNVPADHDKNCGSEEPEPQPDDHTENNQKANTAAADAEKAQAAAKTKKEQVDVLLNSINEIKQNIDDHAETANKQAAIAVEASTQAQEKKDAATSDKTLAELESLLEEAQQIDRASAKAADTAKTAWLEAVALQESELPKEIAALKAKVAEVNAEHKKAMDALDIAKDLQETEEQKAAYQRTVAAESAAGQSAIEANIAQESAEDESTVKVAIAEAKASKDSAARYNAVVGDMLKDIEEVIAKKIESGNAAAKQIEDAVEKYAQDAAQWLSADEQHGKLEGQLGGDITGAVASTTRFADIALEAHKKAQDLKAQAEASDKSIEVLKGLLDEAIKQPVYINAASEDGKLSSEYAVKLLGDVKDAIATFDSTIAGAGKAVQEVSALVQQAEQYQETKEQTDGLARAKEIEKAMNEALETISNTGTRVKGEVLPALEKAVDTATTAYKAIGDYKGEVDGFVKTIQDLYDTALSNNLLAIAAAAEGKQEDAQKLLKDAESTSKSSAELADAIHAAEKPLPDLRKAAGDAYYGAQSMHDAITPDYTAEEILAQLNEAQKLKQGVDDALSQSQDLDKSTKKALEELQQLTYGTLDTELQGLQSSVDDMLKQVEGAAESEERTQALQTIGNVAKYLSDTQKAATDAITDLKVTQAAAEQSAKRLSDTAAEIADQKAQYDGYVKKMQDLYDSAIAANLQAILAAAEESRQAALSLMKNVGENMQTTIYQLSESIEGAIYQAQDLSSTASGARDDAEKLLKELSDQSTADEIMTKLDQAKKLKPTVDGSLTDAEALSKSIQTKLEELKEVSYESIAKELKTLQDSMEDYSNQLKNMPDSDSRTQALETVGDIATYLSNQQAVITDETADLKASQTAADENAEKVSDAVAEVAKSKVEYEGFVKQLQDLFDDAAEANLLAIAALAEKEQEDAQTLMKDVDGIREQISQLFSAIERAVDQATGFGATAYDAAQKAESLHDAITSDYSAEDILVKLDEAKELKQSVDDASTGMSDLSKDFAKNHDDLMKLSFSTIASQIQSLYESVQQMLQKVEKAPESEERTQALQTIGNVVKYFDDQEKFLQDVTASLDEKKGSAEHRAEDIAIEAETVRIMFNDYNKFVKQMQDLYDNASDTNLLEIAAAAEALSTEADNLKDDASIIDSTWKGLLEEIAKAVRTASGYDETAGIALSSANDLYAASKDNPNADEILDNLNKAEPLNVTFVSNSTDATALAESINTKLDALLNLSYQSITGQLAKLDDAAAAMLTQVQDAPDHVTKSEALERIERVQENLLKMTDNLQKEVEFLGLAQSEAPEHAKKVSDFAKSVGSYRMLYENIYAEIQGLYDEAIKDPDNPDDPDEADNEAARKIAEDAINALEAVKRLQEEAYNLMNNTVDLIRDQFEDAMAVVQNKAWDAQGPLEKALNLTAKALDPYKNHTLNKLNRFLKKVENQLGKTTNYHEVAVQHQSNADEISQELTPDIIKHFVSFERQTNNIENFLTDLVKEAEKYQATDVQREALNQTNKAHQEVKPILTVMDVLLQDVYMVEDQFKDDAVRAESLVKEIEGYIDDIKGMGKSIADLIATTEATQAEVLLDDIGLLLDDIEVLVANISNYSASFNDKNFENEIGEAFYFAEIGLHIAESQYIEAEKTQTIVDEKRMREYLEEAEFFANATRRNASEIQNFTSDAIEIADMLLRTLYSSPADLSIEGIVDKIANKSIQIADIISYSTMADKDEDHYQRLQDIFAEAVNLVTIAKDYFDENKQYAEWMEQQIRGFIEANTTATMWADEADEFVKKIADMIGDDDGEGGDDDYAGIQALIGKHLASLDTYDNQCWYHAHDPEYVNELRGNEEILSQINVLQVNCPSVRRFQNKGIVFQFLDTVENWEQTVDSCSNLLEREYPYTDWQGRAMLARTYVSIVNGFDFITFHRPASLPKLQGRIMRFYEKNEFDTNGNPGLQCHEEFSSI